MSILNGPMDPVQALAGSMRDFRELQGPDLIGRVGAFYEWQDLRRTHGLWPYSKSTERRRWPFAQLGTIAVCDFQVLICNPRLSRLGFGSGA